jgi:hypothetical protein
MAASFRVSLTALVPKPDHRSQVARAWLHVHAARIEDAATGRAGPAFGREPSRAGQMFTTIQPREQLTVSVAARDQPRSPHPPCSEQPVWPNFAARGCPRPPRRRVAPGATSPGPRHRVSAEFVICFRCCAATGLWYRRPVAEAGQRALIAHKRMNWFANPPRTQKRYHNPRGFRKKEVSCWSPWARLGRAFGPGKARGGNHRSDS